MVVRLASAEPTEFPRLETAMSLLSNSQAASLLGITPNTLKLWRHLGRGPAFIKLGEAKQAGVAYVEADVLSWRDAHKFTSTSAYTSSARANAKADIRRSAGAGRGISC